MIPEIRTIDELGDIRGKRILLRLDLNVPISGGVIRDPFRIDQTLPTLHLLREKGAKIVLMSHIGKSEKDSLKPIHTYLAPKIPVTFLPNLTDERNREAIHRLGEGEVTLLENLRGDKGEEANDPQFTKLLASYADYYVNDAFSVSHRKHASVVGIPTILPSAIGLQFEKEIAHLSKALHPEHPFLFILGGAKISTKLPLLKKFLLLADDVFVGGALANTLLAASGHQVGASVYDKETGNLDDIFEKQTLELPSDVVVKRSGSAVAIPVSQVGVSDMIVDVGSGSIQMLKDHIARAKLIVWNGPLGFYEEGFKEGTEELLRLIAESKATSIIGGGDTVALIDEMHIADRLGFVSTGGGAMLEYLATETLPGLEALKR